MRGENTYTNLVKRLGEEGAKEYMRDLAKKRKNPGSFHKMSPKKLRKISLKGYKAGIGKEK